jgi:hypothetical protein
MGTKGQAYVYIEYKGKRILVITVYWHGMQEYSADDNFSDQQFDGYDNIGEFSKFLKLVQHKNLTVKQFRNIIYNKYKDEESVYIDDGFACDTEINSDHIYKVNDDGIDIDLDEDFQKSEGHYRWDRLIKENPFYYQEVEENKTKFPEEISAFILT